ncbi:valacyclovir hydrolase [Pochonia chlamydosporia 170]|uniref:Valacyclovir hydrolase n=1 Tax=Pochonia chlamydosporia 170 TaxID=1380566 RepID=A0A179FIG5_METCM|nr:valacyclovir hydrolase [Pochonia chlamydosporia 170]OAQ65217.2 valacyclovir hydrolase [Pochonia chlamydosporia 170]
MTQQLRLSDGRVLDYKISGAQDGFPLLWIHGTPGAYTVFSDLEGMCREKGVKLITMSRAGYGSSTRQRGRCIVDVVPDLKQLTEHLNIKRCFVAGWSGGGPHALACAAGLPGCVATLVIAGVGPWNVEDLDFLNGQGEDNVNEFNAALQGEDAIRQFCEGERPGMIKGDASDLVAAMSSILPDVDKKALLENDTLGQFLVDNIREGLKINSDGWIDDDLAFIQPWGFDLNEIKVPVLLYQGSEDKMVPFAHGEWLAKHIPSEFCKAHLLQGQGHISIVLGQLEAMLDGLLQYR